MLITGRDFLLLVCEFALKRSDFLIKYNVNLTMKLSIKFIIMRFLSTICYYKKRLQVRVRYSQQKNASGYAYFKSTVSIYRRERTLKFFFRIFITNKCTQLNRLLSLIVTEPESPLYYSSIHYTLLIIIITIYVYCICIAKINLCCFL